MIAIFYRIRSKIPVLLMGETGCGKTLLVKFLSCCVGLLEEELVSCDVHGGFGEPEILDIMSKAIERAEEAKKKGENIWVFFDEINTSPEVGLFKEIVCDRSLKGETLPDNLVVCQSSFTDGYNSFLFFVFLGSCSM